MWFSAAIFMQSMRSDSNERGLFQENIIVMNCETEEEAQRLAEECGRSYEHKYRVDATAYISWKFVAIERICQIGERIDSGTEVFTRFLRPTEADSILQEFEDHEFEKRVPGQ